MDLRSYIKFLDAENNELAVTEDVMDPQTLSFVTALNSARPVTLNVGMMGLSVGGVAVARILTHIERLNRDEDIHIAISPPPQSVDNTTRLLMSKALADMEFESPYAMPICEDLEDYTHTHTLLVKPNLKTRGKHKQPFWNDKRW